MAVSNRARSRVEALAFDGVRVADSPAVVATQVDVFRSCVTEQRARRELNPRPSDSKNGNINRADGRHCWILPKIPQLRTATSSPELSWAPNLNFRRAT